MRISNVKVSFLFKQNIFKPINRDKKINFVLNQKYCTLYAHSGKLLNATKFKSFAEINTFQKLLFKLLKQKCQIRIDNIFIR